MSTSSWGRELKCSSCLIWLPIFLSTSSWGRELKYLESKTDLQLNLRRPLREVVSWNCIWPKVKFCADVDLFVRSWVEMVQWQWYYYKNKSTSSWGRELKYRSVTFLRYELIVDLFVRSWVEMLMKNLPDATIVVDLFVRSWVEMLISQCGNSLCQRRPLREVVSWNDVGHSIRFCALESTSSWGRELKC